MSTGITLKNQASLANITAGGVGGGDFLPYAKLCSFNTAEVKEDLIKSGVFGLKSGEEITEVGPEMVALVITARATALDFSDKEKIVETHDPSSDEYARIRKTADLPGLNGCVYGPDFLMWTDGHGFFTMHLGSKSGRRSAGSILAAIKDGDAVSPTFLTLKMKKTKTGDNIYHVVTSEKYEGEVPAFDFDQEKLDVEVERFLNPPARQSGDAAVEDDSEG